MQVVVPRPARPVLRFTLLLALAGGASLSHAADAKPREGSLGKGGGSGPLLTMAQLRQCLAEQDRIAKEGAALVQSQRELNAERVELDRLGTELEADQATLDRTSQAAVDAYNARIVERGKRVEAYRAAAPAFNQRVDKLDGDREAFAKECKDRRYREEDYDAIKAGK